MSTTAGPEDRMGHELQKAGGIQKLETGRRFPVRPADSWTLALLDFRAIR